MKLRLGLLCFLFLPLLTWGQARESYRGLLTPQVRSAKLPARNICASMFVDGKLQPKPHDAIVLTLQNNSAIQVQEAQVETAKFAF